MPSKSTDRSFKPQGSGGLSYYATMRYFKSRWNPRSALGGTDADLGNCPRDCAELSGDPCGIAGTRAELSPLSNSFLFFLLSEERYMGSTLPPENDVWDLDRLRLPAEWVGDLSARRRPPRHRPRDPFIKGPIPYAWIASACRLPGSGLQVAMACRFLCCRFRRREPLGPGRHRPHRAGRATGPPGGIADGVTRGGSLSRPTSPGPKR